jgi:hypothetical protein
VWSDLGFSAGIKTEGGGEIDTSGAHCLKLGLRRENQLHNRKRRGNLPIVMANPPDVCPPDVLSATLASIDVSLAYCLHHEHTTQAQDSSYSEFDHFQREFPHLSIDPNLKATVQPETSSLMPGHSIWLDTILHGTSFQPLESQIPHTPGNGLDPSSDEYFRLFELGMQRLVISNSIKDPKIQVSKDATLKSLPDIAPAIFNSGHREVSCFLPVTVSEVLIPFRQSISEE